MSGKRITKEEYEQAKSKLLVIMTDHIGPNNKIGMGELYERVFGRTYSHRINDTRLLRDIITDLRYDGKAIMSNSSPCSGGYWLAASISEIKAYCDKGKKQAIGILTRNAKIQKVSLPEYLGQVQLELDAKD